MNNITSSLTKSALAAVAAVALFTPIIASAQEYSYNGSADEQIQGTIASIDGTWNITVNDANGYRDNVALHQGTIINPTGLTLEPGMSVTIDGYADGPQFDAMEIDTPYQYEGPPPTAVYYGPGTWYPGYAVGWGPSFSLFFNLNTRRYEQRSFAYGGQVRRPEAPPSGWQSRPHGYIGGNVQYRPQRSAYNAPQPRYVAPPQQQQQRYFAPAPQQPQQQRYYAPAPQQPQRNFAPQEQPQRNFAPQQQPQRNFAPQQQPQRNFAPQQQPQRNYAPQPQQQQQRNYAPQAQQQRSSAPRQQGGDENPQERHR